MINHDCPNNTPIPQQILWRHALPLSPTSPAYAAVVLNHFDICIYVCRAGGKGMAGTAMAVPVLREKKWRRLDSNLRVRYRVASPSSLP